MVTSLRCWWITLNFINIKSLTQRCHQNNFDPCKVWSSGFIYKLKPKFRLKTKNYPKPKSLSFSSALFPFVSSGHNWTNLGPRVQVAMTRNYFKFLVYIYSDLFMYIYDKAIRMDTWFSKIQNFATVRSELTAIPIYKPFIWLISC